MSLNIGNKSMGWTPAPEDLQKAFDDFRDITFEAFKDEVIDKSEKEAIKSHKQLLNNEKTDLLGEWKSINNDSYLPQSNRSLLEAAKNNYVEVHNLLMSKIDTAVSDNKITPKERSAVESAFSNYREKLKAFRGTLEGAVRKIEEERLDSLEIGGGNLMFDSEEEISVFEYVRLSNINTEEDFRGKYFMLAMDVRSESLSVNFDVYFRSSKKSIGQLAAPQKCTRRYKRCYFNLYFPEDGDISDIGLAIRCSKYVAGNSKNERIFVKRRLLCFGKNKVIGWTPAPDDVQTEIGKSEVSVKNSISQQLGYGDYANMVSKILAKGNPITVEGMLNADLIQAALVWARIVEAVHISANSMSSNNSGFKVEMNITPGAPFRVYYPTGEVWKEIVFKNGEMQEIWYDTSGKITSWLDSKGFHLLDFKEEKWVDKTLRYLTSNKNSLTRSSFGISVDWLDNQTPIVTCNNNGILRHEYNSALTSGTLTDPTNHKVIFYSKSKSSTKLPNGVYYPRVSGSNRCSMAFCTDGSFGTGDTPMHTEDDVVFNSSGQFWFEVSFIVVSDYKIVKANKFFFKV